MIDSVLPKSLHDMPQAIISKDGLYRYMLRRDPSRLFGTKPLLMIMLNPSTADSSNDDPTIRRCMGFANVWRCNPLIVVNLFAYRSTLPDALYEAADPIGPENDEAIRQAAYFTKANNGMIVAAWGSHGTFGARGFNVCAELTRDGYEILCLGRNENGMPKHPLYLPYTTVPVKLFDKVIDWEKVPSSTKKIIRDIPPQ